MKVIKHFFEFIFIIIFFLIFKIIGYKYSTNFGEFIGKKIGPFFRSNKKIQQNLTNSNIGNSNKDREIIIENMWGNYGRIFAEYMFIKKYRETNLYQNIEIIGQNILEQIKDNKKPVIFISGHFNNFEFMAMHIERSGIDLAAIYRPLNNKFLNPIMEKIRKNYICKNQIKKGIGGIKELVKLNNDGFSTALMIDQRVSEGIKSNFFNAKAFTTTIPAQLVKKYKIPVVPIFIERFDDVKFKVTVLKPINFNENKSVEDITDHLNKMLENFIKEKPDYWIWSHNRWK